MHSGILPSVLEVIDELSPILEPKPNVRLHRNTPDQVYDKIVDMISSSQGAPFLLNFDERSMAGMMRQARVSGVEHLINETNVHDYAPVGCLENTMVGNDRSDGLAERLGCVRDGGFVHAQFGPATIWRHPAPGDLADGGMEAYA